MRHPKAGGSDGMGQRWGVDLLGGAIIYNSWNNMKKCQNIVSNATLLQVEPGKRN
jgi:hypothetical protein